MGVTLCADGVLWRSTAWSGSRFSVAGRKLEGTCWGGRVSTAVVTLSPQYMTWVRWPVGCESHESNPHPDPVGGTARAASNESH